MTFLLPPVPGFEYNDDPPKGAWTKKYVREALHTQHPKIVDELFNAASNLVASRNLTNDAYKNVPHGSTQKSQDRSAAGQVLVAQFGHRIQVQRYPSFATVCAKEW